MSRHNPVLAVAFSMFLIVLLFVLSPTEISMAEEVKGSDSEAGTGPGISTEAVGGPDAFGYILIDSDELNGPIYNFIDISATGTVAPFTIGNDDDGDTASLPIGFNFNLYGTVYTQVQMDTNGYLDFGISGKGDFSNTCPLPGTDDGPRIAVLHNDLCMNGLAPAFLCNPQPLPATAYYQTFASCPNKSGGDGQCAIYTWENASFLGLESVQFDFQAILYDNGNILTQYAPGNPLTGNGSTTGLQNETDSIGFTYACNTEGTIPDNHAICYIHPDSPVQICDPTPLDLADVNSGVCVFTKSNLNEIHIQGATPNGDVALIMGRGPGPVIINGPICNGLVIDMDQIRLFGIYQADSNGGVHVLAPVPQSGNIGWSDFQVVDITTCSKNEAEKYFLVADELPDVDFDGDGIVNCDDECPTEGSPGTGEVLGADGCVTVACGNEIVDVPEVCDDGNMMDGDGCSADCSMVEPGFICPPEGGSCSPEATCGNVIVEPGEVCDDGNMDVGDGCNEDCTMIEDGFMCPPAGGPCEPEVLCGNGILDGPEACDDGNTMGGDGCSEDCTMIEDGFNCPIPGMLCTRCGNGLIDGTDVCDDGNLMGGDGCSADCTMIEDGYNCIIPGMPCAFCGNGALEPGEECDDGNTTDGDGCSFDCLMVETGYVCPIPGMPCDPIMP